MITSIVHQHYVLTYQYATRSGTNYIVYNFTEQYLPV